MLIIYLLWSADNSLVDDEHCIQQLQRINMEKI